MNQEIVSYLQSARPDFDKGFALFCKYGRNRACMDWISRRHDMDKLLYELGKLAKCTECVNPFHEADMARFSAPAAVVAPAVVTERTEPAPETKVVFRTFDERRTKRSDLPPDLQEVYDAVAEDYKLRRALHEKMKMALTDEDRAGFRARVLESDARIRAGYRAIDDYQAKRASAEEAAKTSFNESTCRSYISKCLKRENNTPRQVAVCRSRVRALLDRGCSLSAETLAALTARGLA